MMNVLHDSAWASWQRVKNIDLRLQRVHAPLTRLRLRRKRRAAVRAFRRALVEQQIRRDAA